MAIGSRINRAALVVSGLALLAGTPAALTAAQVRTPWILACATGAAAMVVGLGAVWLERYKRQAQHRDEQTMEILEGCLMINGRLPKVAQVTDPLYLGVHPAATVEPGLEGEQAAAISRIPTYVPRDADEHLRELLAKG